QDKVLNHRRLNRDDFVRWHMALAAKGWSVPHWPVEWGGTGWSPIQKHIWDEECAQVGAPGVLPNPRTVVARRAERAGARAMRGLQPAPGGWGAGHGAAPGQAP
ncbi:acyl-CoA dehydrogenase family protein, partial [Mycobacterium tuberculosis]|nr:acyl-CoA dehydrogenase family protein [Mycobacterium tuberculosis]